MGDELGRLCVACAKRLRRVAAAVHQVFPATTCCMPSHEQECLIKMNSIGHMCIIRPTTWDSFFVGTERQRQVNISPIMQRFILKWQISSTSAERIQWRRDIRLGRSAKPT